MKQIMIFAFAVVSLIAFAPSSAFATPTTLTVVEMSDSGTAAAANAADQANGNRFQNPDENVFVLLQNTHATNSGTVTITSQHTSTYLPGFGTISRADISVSLAAGDVKIVGPLPRSIFNDASEYVNMTISGTGTVKISPFKGKGLGRGFH
jgi:hypothetical protein